MPVRIRSAAAAALIGLLPLASSARAGECEPVWEEGFGAGISHAQLRANAPVHAMALFDADGPGPAVPLLVAGGEFTSIGGVAAAHIAVWTGNAWLPLDGGVDGPVYALTAHDDGAGPALIVGGSFSLAGGVPAANIAAWRGAWTPIGPGLNGPVRSLVAFDHGAGARLIAGGEFSFAGPTSVPFIAQWDGAFWTHLQFGLNGAVRAMTVFDSGSGPALHVGGAFTIAGAATARHLARWDGASWSEVGGGLTGDARALEVWNDGTGNALYVGGSFAVLQNASIRNVARWNGGEWASLGSGVPEVSGSPVVLSLAAHDDGSGPALYVGGRLPIVGGENRGDVARWNGSTWSSLSAGVNGIVMAMAPMSIDGEQGLLVGGDIDSTGFTTAQNLAFWADDHWAVSTGTGLVLAGRVAALAIRAENGQQQIYAGGDFTNTANLGSPNIARWDGQMWSPLGQGLDAAVTKIVDRPNGLIVTGDFTASGEVQLNRLGRWTGDAWSPFAPGLDGPVFDLQFEDESGDAFVAAGGFQSADGSPLEYVGRWDGSQWHALGSGLDGIAYAMERFNGDLYVGGQFSQAGDEAADSIARWDGAAWSALGAGLYSFNGYTVVNDLQVFDDGSGEALYVCGLFERAGGVDAPGLARWNGVSWSALGDGLPFTALTLAVHDNGDGPALYAAGGTQAGQHGEPLLARWTGAGWVAEPSPTNGIIACLLSSTFQESPALYAGGEFDSIDDNGVLAIAALVGCSEDACPPDLNGDDFIGFADLNIVISHFNEFGDDIPGDIDGDGQVGFADLNIVLSAFNSACPG